MVNCLAFGVLFSIFALAMSIKAPINCSKMVNWAIGRLVKIGKMVNCSAFGVLSFNFTLAMSIKAPIDCSKMVNWQIGRGSLDVNVVYDS